MHASLGLDTDIWRPSVKNRVLMMMRIRRLADLKGTPRVPLRGLGECSLARRAGLGERLGARQAVGGARGRDPKERGEALLQREGGDLHAGDGRALQRLPRAAAAQLVAGGVDVRRAERGAPGGGRPHRARARCLR
eukprot:5753201-Pyramimonas_sp.AAC.3